jgi:hypothetical protein
MGNEDGGRVRMPCSKHINAVYTIRWCCSPLLYACFLSSVALRNTLRSQTAQHQFSMTVPIKSQEPGCLFVMFHNI